MPASQLRRASSNAQNIGVHILVEPNQQRLALSNGGRTQVTRRPQHVREQCLIVGLVFLQVERHDLLALGHDQRACRVGEFQRRLSPQFRTRVGGLFRLDFALRKEPLRFDAGRSPLAVVVPVNVPCHGRLPRQRLPEYATPHGDDHGRIVRSHSSTRNLRRETQRPAKKYHSPEPAPDRRPWSGIESSGDTSNALQPIKSHRGLCECTIRLVRKTCILQ